MRLTYKDYLIPAHVPEYRTLLEMVRDVCSRFADKTAFRMKDDDGTYREMTYRRLGEESDNLARFLVKMGLNRDSKAAIQSENRPEWAVSYLAIMKAGITIVPVDAALGAKDVGFIMEHSGATVVFTSHGLYNKTWKDSSAACPGVRHIVSFDEPDQSDDRLLSYTRCIGEGARVSMPLPSSFSPDDLLEILYTSGTTGNPKAVMLTHGNVAANIAGIHRMIHFDETDTFLSVLPVHHVFECTVGFLSVIGAGASITIAESLKSSSIIADIRETNVTLMLGVPLLFEKLYFGIIRAVGRKSPALRLSFHLMLALVRAARILARTPLGGAVFRGLRRKAGLDSLRLAVSGGGPLPYPVARGFTDLGFKLIQGYGLSETSPVLTVSTLAHNNIHSTGLPLPGAEIRIDEPDSRGIGEIAVRGPMVMKGYYRNVKATAEVMNEGWFRTGDAGLIDRRGFIHITGRLKNVIVTHGGKNVYPEELEEKLDASPLVKESMVFGEPESEEIRGERVRAIVVPDEELIREEWGNLHHSHRYPEPTDEAIRHEIERWIAHVNHHLPAYKRITGWALHKAELEKTSTRKIKRFIYQASRGS